MRRLLFFTAVALILALSFAGFLQLRQRQIAARRFAKWQAEREEDAIPSVLAHEFEWQRADLTLAQFADLVASRSGLPVEVDKAGIDADVRMPRLSDIKVHVPRGNFPLHLLLRMVLALPRLEANLNGQALVITTLANSNAKTRLRTAVYPIPQPQPRGLNESDWAQILAANIDGHVEAVPGALIVVANASGQRRARLIIDTICSLKEAEPHSVVIPPNPLTSGERRILAALDEPANLDVVEMPLKDVVLHLVDRHGIPLILMADKLEEASVSLDTPITKSLDNISLQSALRLMLRDLELTYVMRHEALIITTPEDAESQVRILAYPVSDLAAVYRPDGTLEPFADMYSLEELVSACIAPDSWGDSNGGGPRGVGDAWLLVEQTDYVHEQVAGLFAAMRRILASAEHVETQPVTPLTDADQKIRAALERPIRLQFSETPLKDVVSFLAEQLKIPIVLNTKKLEEASISADTPVTQDLPTGRAWDQLDLLLKSLNLDFVVRNEVVQITTPEDSESQLDTRIYDTRQLIRDRLSADELRDLIPNTVQPRSWDNSGGPGHVDVYRDLLVIRHTERVHEQIEKLLARLTGSPSHPTRPPASVEKH